MKFKLEGFRLIEGHRFPAGREYEVDKKFDGDVDHFGRRVSKAFYDKHFAPPKETKAAPAADKTEE